MEGKSPGPTNQTHTNGLGRTGSVKPVPPASCLTLTLIPSPAPATESRPHSRRWIRRAPVGYFFAVWCNRSAATSFTNWPREIVSFSSVCSRRVEPDLGAEVVQAAPTTSSPRPSQSRPWWWDDLGCSCNLLALALRWTNAEKGLR
jgi:hypothetical protein